jgi:hypothetical protein
VPASPKRPSKRTPGPRVKPLAKASSPSPKPFLRFYHSEKLRAKTLDVLATLEQSADATRHRGSLTDIVMELTSSGLDYYFLRPMKLAQVGFFTEQSASLGMAGTTQVLGAVIRNIIGSMDHPQLLTLCSYIRQLME